MANQQSKSKESYFSRYKQAGVYAANRKRRLERVMREQPNNLQIPLALKNITSYRRKDPKAPYWSHTMIKDAMLMKAFTGKFNKNIFSVKPDDYEAAIRDRNPNIFLTSHKLQKPGKRVNEFSLGFRAHDKQGNPVWSL